MGPPSPKIVANPTVCILKQQWGDATRTARLKPGADKSGNKTSPRRAEVFAPPIRGEAAGHRPFAPFALSPLVLGFNQSQIRIDHDTDELLKPDLRFPI